MTCPHCQQTAAFQEHRRLQPLSLLGPLTYTRAYYYCRRCGTGFCPFDAAVGLTGRRLTPGLERAASLAGTVAGSFREAWIVAVHRSAVRDRFVRYALAIRHEQAVQRFVVIDCSKCILSRERMPTRGDRKGNDENEVPASPNSHTEGSMNGRGSNTGCDVCLKDAR